ncbi:MAG: SdpI family protein [Halobacteriota archaeon]|nr:SdpI family protein [Halobacteriota archaeon]
MIIETAPIGNASTLDISQMWLQTPVFTRFISVLIICISLIIAGLIIYYLSPRMGPNLFLGMRTGYTVIDREIWVKSNRLIGKMFIVCGFLFLVISIITREYWIDDFFKTFAFLISAWMSVVLLASIITHRRSVRLAEELNSRESIEGPVKRLKQIKIPFIWVAIPVIEFLLLLFISIVYYGRLSQDIRIVFDIAGETVGIMYVSRFYYMTFIIGFGALYALMNPIIVWIGRKKPIFMYRGLLKVRSDDIMKFNCMMYIFGMWILIIPHISIIYYNIYNEFFLGTLPILSIIFILLIIPFVWLANQSYRFKKERELEIKNNAK